jgi:O-antigen ligase
MIKSNHGFSAVFLLAATLFFLPLSIVAVEIFSSLYVINFLILRGWRDVSANFLNVIVIFIVFMHFVSSGVHGFDPDSIHSALQSLWLLYIPITSAFFLKNTHVFVLQRWYVYGQIVNALVGIVEALGFHVINTYGQGHLGLVSFHIWSSMMLALAILFLINDIPGYNIVKNRILSVTVLALLVWQLLSTSGRTGQAVLIMVLFFIIVYKIKNKKVLGISIVGALSLAVLFPAFRSVWSAAYYQTVNVILNGSYLSSVGLRVVYAQASWLMFVEHPIFGVGVGQFRHVFYEMVHRHSIPYVPNDFRGVVGPTSTYLQYVSELGGVGATLLLAFLVGIGMQISNQWSRGGIIRLIVFLWLIIGSFSDVILSSWSLVIPFSIFVSLQVEAGLSSK